MKKLTSIIYVIFVLAVCALIFAAAVMFFNKYGDNLFADNTQTESSSAFESISDSHGHSSYSAWSDSASQSSFDSTVSHSYAVKEYSFDLAGGYDPLENYGNSYAIVIPMDRFSADLPDEGYIKYRVSSDEQADDYLGELSPVIYYEIKYEYGCGYYTDIILIPRSAFTIIGGQAFMASAVPDTVFNENYYESVYSDGTFLSIKIVSRDQYFIVSDRSSS